MNLHEWEQEVNRHDLTHGYSDDHNAWSRGAAHHDKIHKAAMDLPREDVERIWNAMVDRKLVEEVRSQFYWRWPDTRARSCSDCGKIEPCDDTCPNASSLSSQDRGSA